MAVPAQVLVVEKLPVLATGKTDYPAVTEMAKERLAKKPELAA